MIEYDLKNLQGVKMKFSNLWATILISTTIICVVSCGNTNSTTSNPGLKI